MDSQEILDALEGKTLEEQKAILEQLQLPVTPPATEVEPPSINMAAQRVLEGNPDVSFEVDGIQVTLNRAVLDDWETAETIASIQDDATPEEAKFVASVKLVRQVFGEDWPRIKAELAAKHAGRLPASVVMDFFETCLQNLGDDGKN